MSEDDALAIVREMIPGIDDQNCDYVLHSRTDWPRLSRNGTATPKIIRQQVGDFLNALTLYWSEFYMCVTCLNWTPGHVIGCPSCLDRAKRFDKAARP